jgi:hypothetical protein
MEYSVAGVRCPGAEAYRPSKLSICNTEWLRRNVAYSPFYSHHFCLKRESNHRPVASFHAPSDATEWQKLRKSATKRWTVGCTLPQSPGPHAQTGGWRRCFGILISKSERHKRRQLKWSSELIKAVAVSPARTCATRPAGVSFKLHELANAAEAYEMQRLAMRAKRLLTIGLTADSQPSGNRTSAAGGVVC